MSPVPYQLKNIRNKKGLSQRELESKSGVSRKSIERAEKHTESRNVTVKRLARALGVSVEELCPKFATNEEALEAIQEKLNDKSLNIRYTPQQINKKIYSKMPV